MNGVEIERKYLIERPEISKIVSEQPLRAIEITQTYLKTENETERRIRRTIENGKSKFFYTEKIVISSIKRTENENEISEEEYRKLMKEKDESLHKINKIRYVFYFKTQKFEMDFYDFSERYATMEIELENEETRVDLPDFVKVISDVTDNKEFKNKSLSRTGKLPL